MADDTHDLNFGPDDSIHIETPTRNHFSNFNLQKSGGLKNVQASTNYKYVNVLSVDKNKNKFTLNGQFQKFLNADQSNQGIIIPISFLGAKKIGKSFLLDNILSLETGQIRRIMCRNNQQPINSPTLTSHIPENNRIIYLDNNGDPTPPIFLWLYFISSVMVYNLTPNNDSQQNTFFQCLLYASNNLKVNFNQVSKPQLVIVRRDVGRAQVEDFQLLRKIGQFQMFLPDVIVFHLPYPGKKNVLTKQLIDVPQKQLSSQFLTQVSKIHKTLQSPPIKQISTQALSPQTLPLILLSLTKSINHNTPVSSKKIMEYIYETLSVSYYNNYLKCYSQELEKEFDSQEPCDKYGLYKKLNNIKRRANRKMEKYNMIGNQPIFHKYKQKLQETIKSKQQLLKNINQSKSRQVHQKNLTTLLTKLNQKNYETIIDEYCKSALDEQKMQVLLQNYQKIIKTKQNPNPVPIPLKTTRAIKHPPPEIENLEKELEELDKIITVKSRVPVPVKPNLDGLKSVIQGKRAELMALRKEEEKLEKLNTPQFILSQQPKNQELAELQSERQKLNAQIQNYQKQIDKLCIENERKLKQTKLKLKKQLAEQQENIKKSKLINKQQIVYKSKVAQAGKSTEKTCCSLI